MRKMMTMLRKALMVLSMELLKKKEKKRLRVIKEIMLKEKRKERKQVLSLLLKEKIWLPDRCWGDP